MATEGHSVQVACRVLGVSESGYYAWRKRPCSARAVRHAWRTDCIRAVHTASRGTYGARRVQAELVLGQGITVSHQAVERLMRAAGIRGISGRPRYRKSAPQAAATDRVGRQFARGALDQLWVTDITKHPPREGKVYCAVVLDACSRRVVGWSIDAAPTAALVTNALSMAIETRRPTGPTVIHSGQGPQYSAWAFTCRAQEAGVLPSLGPVRTCFENALRQAFWSRVQVELLDRHAWSTRLELATALFEYLELFHNRQRRHSSLGMLTPIEFEARRGAAATNAVA